MYRWYAKHTRVAYIVGTVPFYLLCIFATYMNPKLYFLYYLFLIVIVINIALVRISKSALFKRALKSFENYCDPYPLIKETTEELFLYKHNLGLLLNKVSALREIGKIEDAYEILHDLKIEKYTRIDAFSKIAYYHHMTDLYILKENIEQAKIYFDKECQLIDSLKNIKLKEHLTEVSMLNKASLLILGGEYDEAEKILQYDFKVINSTRAKVNMQFLLGKVYFYKCNTQKAIDALQYVRSNCNKLYCCKLAKGYLSQMHTPDEVNK